MLCKTKPSVVEKLIDFLRRGTNLTYRLHQCLGVKRPGTEQEEKCTKYITWQFAICSDCEGQFGNRATKWPNWLRDSWNAEQRRRRRSYREAKNEVSFTDLALALRIDDE